MANFPSTFPPALVAHCLDGSVPAEVFTDAHSQLAIMPRYVRVHPSHLEEVCDAGDEEAVSLWSSASSLTSSGNSHSANDDKVKGDHDDLSTIIEALVSLNSTPLASSYDITSHLPLSTRLRLGLCRLLGLPLHDVVPVMWLPCYCFALPRHFSLHNSLPFQRAVLVGMDAASMAAVVALQPRRGEAVLDLCCAPGMKLQLIADAVAPTGASTSDGTSSGGVAVGVDLSVDRLFACRSVVKKHAASSASATSSAPIALFAADGSTFSLHEALGSFDTGERASVNAGTGLTAREERRLRQMHTSGKKRPRSATGSSSPFSQSAASNMNEGAPLVVYASTEARQVLIELCHGTSENRGSDSCGLGLFDRVLVDAECTHDGSLAHLWLGNEGTIKGKSAGIEVGKFYVAANANMEQQEEQDSKGARDTRQNLPHGGGIDNLHRMQRMNVAQLAGANDSLLDLQLALLLNGYSQLRLGGVLVYCTCSFSYQQNENIVHRFLQLVNSSSQDEQQQQQQQYVCGVRVRAVLVPAFSRAHEAATATSTTTTPTAPLNKRRESSDDRVAACLRFEDSSAELALQDRLDRTNKMYSVVARGAATAGQTEEVSGCTVGSRLWPAEFQTSFQYIAKIHKMEVE